LHSFSSFKEAQNHLNQSLKRLNERKHYEHKIKQVDLMNKEKAVSKLAVMTPFDVADLVECRVDKYSTVVIKQNHYSVPEGHVGKYIKAKVGAEEIKLFVDGELVAQHPRNWGVHQWEMNIYHYLKTFQRKKGAIAQSECLKQAPAQIKNLYNNYYIGKEKEFLELLLYIQENNNLDSVMKAVGKLNAIRLGNVNTERIIFVCEQSTTGEMDEVSQDETVKQSESNMKAYTNMFNQLEEGVTYHG